MEDGANMIAEGYRELLKHEGCEPQMEGAVCIIHKTDHPNCKGCESEMACHKLCAMMLVTARAMSYTPKDFDDFVAVERNTADRITAIVRAKSMIEIDLAAGI